MIAVSMGDPAGVGPEIVLKGHGRGPRRFYLGDPGVYRETARHFHLEIPIQEVDSPEAAAAADPGLFCVQPVSQRVPTGAITFGRANLAYAAATVESVESCCRLAVEDRVEAMVTPPIHKAVLHAAGYAYPGHTELLGTCTGTSQPVMMLTGSGLRVVPVTIHQSLATVSQSIDPEILEHVLVTTWQALIRDFGLARPRVAVSGLNPHAGEEGSFGMEERLTIEPVCRRLRSTLGDGLTGPHPADTLFHPRARATYDAVVCMYHDQALIPLKMLAFGEAVNITLGLPIVRTSVDHGTAYDIAGRGLADGRSYAQALQLAQTVAHNRRNSR